MRKITLVLFFSGIIVFSCKKVTEDVLNEEEEIGIIENKDKSPKISTETVLTGRGNIWGFEFLDQNRIIFTEKLGKIGIWENQKVTEISGFPDVIHTNGQGGLLDICLHPNYKNNGWIYITYNQNENTGSKLTMARFKVVNNKIENFERLFSTTATNTWKGHNGSRMVFDKAGFLYLSIGEGGTGSYGGSRATNKNAQDLRQAWGKIHRFTDGGAIPSDNPVWPGESKPSSIYAYGIRNPQGLTLNTDTGQIFENEHGPRGGDEFNLIKKGANYGWPNYSLGVNYDGGKISDSHTASGITAPELHWTPSIGASGLEYISSDKYGNWKGSYLNGGLALQQLSRVFYDNNSLKSETLLNNIGRVREVKQSPDGYLYISVENPGRILKLVPTF